MQISRFALSDLCRSITDCPHSTPQWTESGNIVIRNQNIKNGMLDLSTPSFTNDEDFRKRLSRATPVAGDIIITREAPMGEVCRIPENVHCCLGQRMVLLKPDYGKVNGDYLLYALMSKEVQFQISWSNGTGTTVSNLRIPHLCQLKIPCPNLDYQNRIASVVSTLNNRIKLNRQINDNLLQQARAVFRQEFLSFEGIPDGWREDSLLGIADYLNGLAMQRFRPHEGEIGLPVLKIKELRQGSCDSNSELCSPSIKSEYIVHDGDVIFSWSGSLLVDLWCGGICGLNQHLFKVTSSAFDKWFYYAWTNHHLQEFIAIAADKATTMGHIKREELSKAKVLVPPKAEYDRIGALLAPIYDLVIANRIENRKLAELRDQILPRLMSGEIDASSVTL